MSMNRTAEIQRKTNETEIAVTLNLDGSGVSSVNTGIGFFDHMLTSFARHGFFDLELNAKGDLAVDCHHTVEDVGIVLGTAIREAAGEKRGIRRFGSAILPMDDALVLAAVDLSGRSYMELQARFTVECVGDLETETVREFFWAVADAAGMNLHLRVLTGSNNHHIIEALFKAFAKALDEALCLDPRIGDILSTKGSL